MRAKNYQTTTVTLSQKELKAINDLAMKNLKKTGTFSRSEATRQLINAGAEALRNAQNSNGTRSGENARN
jgi:metal-responsive CopG/Arc/MetJ family transcriptional regulator